uniref:Uncharacterized protein n=1 Tax=Panagrolaimus sp. ES5 TaxID=591445 RepID=A0AC34G846_9BILA
LSISSVSNPSQYNVADFTIFIVDPNPDIYAPICEVLNTTVYDCPTDKSICNTVSYEADLSFYDIGTGVYRVDYNYGSWNIPESDLFNTSDASNRTFYATGIISCCNNTLFSVIDGASLVGQCSIKVKYVAPTTTVLPPTTSITPTFDTTEKTTSTSKIIFDSSSQKPTTPSPATSAVHSNAAALTSFALVSLFWGFILF